MLFFTLVDGALFVFHFGHARACVGTSSLEFESHQGDSSHLSAGRVKRSRCFLEHISEKVNIVYYNDIVAQLVTV